MMLEERVGDIFSVTEGILMHGCNAKGVMGAGVALTVKEKYPMAYESYKLYCESMKFNGVNPVGHVHFHHEGKLTIANAITQFNPGKDATIEAIQNCLITTAQYADYMGFDLHSVQIGCGIGGLHWSDVKNVYNYVSTINPNVNIIVWKLQ